MNELVRDLKSLIYLLTFCFAVKFHLESFIVYLSLALTGGNIYFFMFSYLNKRERVL